MEHILDSSIRLNLKQSKFYESLFNGDNIEYLGYGGTGKTFSLTYSINKLKEKKKDINIIKVAHTGVAAIQIGGATIHSTFRLDVGYKYINFMLLSEEDKKRYLVNRSNGVRYKIGFDIIIFDEVSMIDAAIFDYIDYYIRYHNRSDLPFGGIQIIVMGDYGQIPPIINDIELYKKYYGEHSEYNASVSNVYKKVKFKKITLTKVIRQLDKGFISKIKKVRKTGYIDYEDFKDNKLIDWKGLDKHIILAPYRKMVDGINKRNYKFNNNKEFNYKGIVSGNITENEANRLAQINLYLKEGLRVMLTKNIIEGGEIIYYNGDLGIIKKIHKDYIIVLFDRTNEEYMVTIAKWEKNKYNNIGDKDIIGVYKQIPLILGYALTIHRVQGLTLDKAIIYPYSYNITNSFGKGLNYVAISRIKSLEGLKIRF